MQECKSEWGVHAHTRAHTHSLTSESSSGVSREIQSKNARHTRTVQTLHREIEQILEIGHILHYNKEVMIIMELSLSPHAPEHVCDQLSSEPHS